jgi:hypothetical protein
VKLRVLRVKQGGAMARSLRVLVVLVGFLVTVVAPPAQAQGTLSVEIGKRAALVDGGQAVDVQVMVTCPAGAEVLEAFLYVTQEGNESDFAFFQPLCDGTAHPFTVRAQAVDAVFHRGKARVSAYILLTSGESTSPTRVVKLRG